MFTLEARIRVRGPLGAWGWGTALLASRGRGRGSAGPQPVWDRVGQVTQPPVSPATWGARLTLQGPRDPGRGVREVTQPVFTKLLRQEPDAGAPGVGTQTDAHLVGARREARGTWERPRVGWRLPRAQVLGVGRGEVRRAVADRRAGPRGPPFRRRGVVVQEEPCVREVRRCPWLPARTGALGTCLPRRGDGCTSR